MAMLANKGAGGENVWIGLLELDDAGVQEDEDEAELETPPASGLRE